MLVTCYYDIYNNPEGFFKYVTLFYDLGISGLPIVLFVEPSMVYKFRIFPSSVKVVGLPLEEVEMYQIAMSYTGELPTGRTVAKDTKEFYALMNSKIEFVKRAAALFSSDKYMWIDFGITKIFKNTERCLNKLHDIEKQTFTKITAPSCWSFGRPMSVEQIHWRFAGGVIIIPADLVDDFYNHCTGVLRDFCTMPQYKLTWETNIWSLVELFAMKDKIHTFFSDHNDSIILNC